MKTVQAVRNSLGSQIELMIDYNQGLNMAEAMSRCHMIDDLGLSWIEEPIVYDNMDGYAQLTSDLQTPIQIGENFYIDHNFFFKFQRSEFEFKKV